MAGWSYSAGEWGKRVRVFEKGADLFIDWFDTDHEGTKRRQRMKLPHRDKARAKAETRKVAAGLELMIPAVPKEKEAAPLTVRTLLGRYTEEVTPSKGDSKKGHDLRAERVFLTFFDAQKEEVRRSTRHPSTLDRVDWDRFIKARREGKIAGWEAVKNRQVQYDLKYLIAVLSWAVGVKQEGEPLLQRNPWGDEVRRAQKWPMPKEQNPTRVAMTDAIRDKLIEHAPHWQFGLALIIERHTRRRNMQVRQLVWSDVDLEKRRMRWRPEIDKTGRGNWTPMPDAVYEALSQVPRGIGQAPIFPSDKDPSQPTPRDTFQTWLRRAKARAKIHVPGLGFHSEKRAGVRDPEFRALPAALQEELAGTSFVTLKNVYDEVSIADMEAAQKTLDRRTG